MDFLKDFWVVIAVIIFVLIFRKLLVGLMQWLIVLAVIACILAGSFLYLFLRSWDSFTNEATVAQISFEKIRGERNAYWVVLKQTQDVKCDTFKIKGDLFYIEGDILDFNSLLDFIFRHTSYYRLTRIGGMNWNREKVGEEHALVNEEFGEDSKKWQTGMKKANSWFFTVYGNGISQYPRDCKIIVTTSTFSWRPLD